MVAVAVAVAAACVVVLAGGGGSESFIHTSKHPHHQDCPMQRPGFNIQCNDGNKARWGFCLNCASQGCQSLGGHCNRVAVNGLTQHHTWTVSGVQLWAVFNKLWSTWGYRSLFQEGPDNLSLRNQGFTTSLNLSPCGRLGKLSQTTLQPATWQSVRGIAQESKSARPDIDVPAVFSKTATFACDVHSGDSSNFKRQASLPLRGIKIRGPPSKLSNGSSRASAGKSPESFVP